jgi:hypothetical protein
MMQFEDLWQLIEKRNKQLAKGKVTMSTDNFKKALMLAYQQGEKRQRDTNQTTGLFGSIFR